jgi:glycosyltransferase involved in cell wall biosynthesis
MSYPLISLIFATIQRTEEVENFLCKLLEQTYKEVEVILVDQNFDDRLIPTISKFKGQTPIIHIVSQSGLSKARNAGLPYAKGELIAFPDDDCWYPPNLLSTISDYFSNNLDWDGITGIASSGKNNSSIWKWDRDPGRCTLTNVWQRGMSITCFLRRRVIDKIGLFDEELGLGSSTPWQSGEETDYLIRAIQAGFHIQYLPEKMVYHHDALPDYTDQEIQKAYFSGCGMGHVLHKHSYPFLYSLSTVARPLLSAARATMNGHSKKATYCKAIARGRWNGLTGKTI